VTLKPCPFCGAEMEFKSSWSDGWADHPANDCVLATTDGGFPLSLAEDEFPAWNRRADEPEEGR
jgi:hypothetical protein